MASSVTAQHIEAPLRQTINIRIAEAGFVVKMNIFAPELKFPADFSLPAVDLPGAGIFFKADKNGSFTQEFPFCVLF